MFSLKIHSVDASHPLFGLADRSSVFTGTTASSSNPNFDLNERRGVIHLFRSVSRQPTTSLPKPTCCSTILFVVAVPNYLSSDDFLRFCGSYVEHISELVIIRNDALEDRYSVLIKFVNQLKADGFYCDFNGKRFSSTEAEVCHVLFTYSVECTEFAELASAPPAGFTELPTCPVCLERLDQDTSGILSALCDHSFQCSCISKWTYLSCQVCRLCQQKDEKPSCSVCGTSENLWVCLICGFLGCGRYKEGHAIRHWKDTQHCYSLDLEAQRVWDYVGDIYVHRLNHSKGDCKLVTNMSSRCISTDGDCGYTEDSGISGALYNSKVEAIVDEYNRLLATQLDTQRQYYESLLAEAKAKREVLISEAVEKTVNSKLLDLQITLEKCTEATKAVAATNQNLMRNQEAWRKKIKEIEEREVLALRSKDEKILDLEEQIRDLKVYVEAQKTFNQMADSAEIKGGTILPVPPAQSTTSNSKKHTKSGRRRT